MVHAIQITGPVLQLVEVDYETKLETLEEENLFFDEELAELSEMCDRALRAKDRGDFETALSLKQQLIGKIKLCALGMGITKEILAQA